MSIKDLLRPEIAAMRPYSAAEQVFDTVRLNANEAPWDTAGDRFRRPLNRYPEIRPQQLRQLMAERFDVATDSVLVTRGSSEAIDLLIRAACNAGTDNIVTTSPTFSMYRHYADIQGAFVREVPLDKDNDFALDSEALLDAVDDETRIVFLCSPNNPTGTSIPLDLMEGVLRQLRDRCIVVVDEAYIEFSKHLSMTSKLARFPNLVVLRTLSKALAFAGARCGTAIGDPELIGVLDAIQAPYAVSTPVVETVEDALTGDNIERAAAQVATLIAERERVRAELEGLPQVEKIWPSDANFLLVRFRDVDSVLQSTREGRVLLRYFGASLGDCARISIGTVEENDAMLNCIRDLEAAA